MDRREKKRRKGIKGEGETEQGIKQRKKRMKISLKKRRGIEIKRRR